MAVAGDRDPHDTDVVVETEPVDQCTGSLGRTQEAIDAGKDAAALWQQLGRYERYPASVSTVCLQLNWGMDFGASLVESERDLAVLQAAPIALRAPLLYQHASALANRGDVAEALEKLADADAACALLADPRVQAAGMLSASLVNFCAMRMTRAGECARQAREAMTALGKPWEAIDSAYISAVAELHLGCLQGAAAPADNLEPQAERIGHRNAQWTFRTVRPVLAYLAGDLAGAEREAKRVLDFGRVHHLTWAYLTELRLGESLFLQGKTEAVIEIARRGAAFESPSRYKQHSRGWLFRCLSYFAPDAARTYLRDTEIPLPTDGAVNAYGHWFNLMNVVEGLYVLGDRDAVATLMPLTETFAASEITVNTFGTLPRAAAGLAAACAGAWDAAEAHFREGLALLRLHPGHPSQRHHPRVVRRHADDARRWWRSCSRRHPLRRSGGELRHDRHGPPRVTARREARAADVRVGRRFPSGNDRARGHFTRAAG